MIKIFMILAILTSISANAEGVYTFNAHEYPPYEYNKDGKPVGPMIDIMKAMCFKANVRCHAKITSLAVANAELKSGKDTNNNTIHGALMLVKTPARDAVGIISTFLVQTDFSYIGHNKSAPLKSVNELKDWTISALVNSSTIPLIQKDLDIAGGGRIVQEDSTETIVKNLVEGRYGENAAAVASEQVLFFWADQYNYSNLMKIWPLKTDNFGIYFSKTSTNQKTYEKFNNALLKLKRSGKIKKILAKYPKYKIIASE